MNKLSLKIKLLSIVAMFAAGGSVYVFMVNEAMTPRLEDSDYRSVMALRDLTADILPPPMYVLEAYAVARELSIATSAADQRHLIERFRALSDERATREAFWTENSAELGIGHMLGAVKGTPTSTAKAVFKLGNEALIPAVERGDREAVLEALAELKTAYYEHRDAIDDLVNQVLAQTKAAEVTAAEAISTRKRNLNTVGIIVLLLGTVAAWFTAQGISYRAQNLGVVLNKVAEGDLTKRAAISSRDELGEIARQLNATLAAVEDSFREVRTVAFSLANTAPNLAASSDEISSGAQQQAASLEETAASLEQITAAVKQSAGNAQQASQLALSSREVAERGGEVVNEAVRAMNEIRTSSRQIADIITTIDEVALQTNLLALNAAVEAARAGEMGRGFAVVAAEVGNLAQRSAAAAKEVKSLIENSLQRVENGHALVDESGKSLREIILSVKKVTDVVGEIAAAAREQSVGVDQVNQAVSQMDQVTQTNAAQTQALSHTADTVSHSARQLRELVDRYELGNGTVDSGSLGHGGRGGRGPIDRLPLRRPLAPENDNHPPVDPRKVSGGDFEIV